MAIHDFMEIVGLRGVRRLHIPPVPKRREFPSGTGVSIGFAPVNTHSTQATEIKLRTRSRVLEVAFEDGARHLLPFEYLRV